MVSSISKICDFDKLTSRLNQWKAVGEKIVFTNGCFDILHLGHIDYLEKARQFGDRLIVGVNSDMSVKRLKGSGRPVNTEYARMRMLAALEFVDLVVRFEEDTPLELISDILPDVLVKGNDYELSNIVGADVVMKNGGAIKTIELVEGFSTTKLIERIKE